MEDFWRIKKKSVKFWSHLKKQAFLRKTLRVYAHTYACTKPAPACGIAHRSPWALWLWCADSRTCGPSSRGTRTSLPPPHLGAQQPIKVGTCIPSYCKADSEPPGPEGSPVKGLICEYAAYSGRYLIKNHF